MVMPLTEHARLTPREIKTLQRIQRLQRYRRADWRPRTISKLADWGFVDCDQHGALLLTPRGRSLLKNTEEREQAHAD